MERYPHTLNVKWTDDGSYDSDGDYVIGTSQEIDIEGRAEANGKGNLVRTEDGGQVVYAWDFFFEPISEDIPFGADATLTHETGTWNGKVQRVAVNQRGARAWL